MLPKEDASIPRGFVTIQETHLEQHPDWSDAETWSRTKLGVLSEDANTTLTGVFDSTKTFLERVCESLLHIWIERRKNPKLILQPAGQWKQSDQRTTFIGYDYSPDFGFAVANLNGIVIKRRKAASAHTEAQRGFWKGSPWLEDRQ